MMKELKSNSKFSFRKTNNRCSLNNLKDESKCSDVDLKRTSWSMFTLNKHASVDNKSRMERKSQSTEEIKNISRSINSTGECGRNKIFKSSNSSILSNPSSFSPGSSANSSPKTKRNSIQSIKSSITSILEGHNNFYDSSSTFNEFGSGPISYIHYNSSVIKDEALSRSADDVLEGSIGKKLFRDDDSLLNESLSSSYDIGRSDSHDAPKILYAHVKTQNFNKKTKQQLLEELEQAKTKGKVTESRLNKNTDNDKKVKNLKNNFQEKDTKNSSYKFIQSYNFFNRFDNRKDKTDGNKDRLSHSISVPNTPNKSLSYLHSSLSLNSDGLRSTHLNNKDYPVISSSSESTSSEESRTLKPEDSLKTPCHSSSTTLNDYDDYFGSTYIIHNENKQNVDEKYSKTPNSSRKFWQKGDNSENIQVNSSSCNPFSFSKTNCYLTCVNSNNLNDSSSLSSSSSFEDLPYQSIISLTINTIN